MFKWFSLSSRPRAFEFRCAECGDLHRGSPSFSYAQPGFVFTVPEEERAARVRQTSDTCIVDDEFFFIRGVLELPIHGADEPFTWGVWASQSEESFRRYVDTFDADQSGDGSFGWLDVTMPGYAVPPGEGERVSLACNVQWRGAGERPLIEPQECDHPLYVDFTQGIPWDRAIALARLTMHGSGEAGQTEP